MKRSLSLALLAVSLWAPAVRAQTFNIDPAHSNVNFSIRHLVGRVTGHFGDFMGTFEYDGQSLSSLKTEATIQTASINTGVEKRDAHLQSPDFFDAVKYPTITFKSTGVSFVSATGAKVAGNLTMHGVTKPVALDVEFGGSVKGPDGKDHAGLFVKGKLNRRDFGIWAGAKEMGGMVGEDVAIEINIEGVAK